MVRPDRAVAGLNDRPLDDRKEVPLHPLAAHVGTAGPSPGDDLVQLVQKDDAVLLDLLQCLLREGVRVYQLLGLLTLKSPQGLPYLHPALLRPLGQDSAEHLVQVDSHGVHPGAAQDGNGRRVVRDLDVDLAVVQPPIPQHRQELGPSRLLSVLLLGGTFLLRIGRPGPGPKHLHEIGDGEFLFAPGQQDVDQTLLRPLQSGALDVLQHPPAHHGHGKLDEVADHGLHVPSHIPHLRELRGLDLDEGGMNQRRQTPGYFSLPHARRPHHQDVLGHDLARHLGREQPAAQAVAKRHRHRALGLFLTYDIAVQILDHPGGRQGGLQTGRHSSTSSVTTLSV